MTYIVGGRLVIILMSKKKVHPDVTSQNDKAHLPARDKRLKSFI